MTYKNLGQVEFCVIIVFLSYPTGFKCYQILDLRLILYFAIFQMNLEHSHVCYVFVMDLHITLNKCFSHNLLQPKILSLWSIGADEISAEKLELISMTCHKQDVYTQFTEPTQTYRQ